MRNLRRLGSTFLALVMCLALSVPAFAAEGNGNVTLTIENAKPGATYNVYKLADVTVSEAGNAYSYQSTAAWAGFWKAAQYDGLTVGEGDLPYFVWEKGVANDNIGATIADAAKKYATDNSVDADKTIDVPADDTVKTKNITDTLSGDGYYMVLSSLGFASMLDTAQGGKLTISEKNLTPSIIQFIKGDVGNEKQRLYNETVAVGDIRTIQAIIEVPSKAKATGLKAAFDLADGLTFVKVSDFAGDEDVNEAGAKLIGVMNANTCECGVGHKFGCVDGKGYPKATVYGSGNAGYPAQNQLFDVKTDETGCDFSVTFKKDFLDYVDAGEKVLIEYSVMVNENVDVSYPSVVGLPDGVAAGAHPNTSVVTLYYGDNNSTLGNTSEVAFFTLALPVYKFANEDENDALADAEFSMKCTYAMDGNAWPMYFEKISDGDNDSPVRYRAYSRQNESKTRTTSVVTPESGRVFIEGIWGSDKAMNYILSEDAAPAGYNKLDDTKTVAFGTSDTKVEYFPENDSIMPAQASVDFNTAMSMKDTSAEGDATPDLGAIAISNVSGTKMPETGGSGVTLILLSGAALLAMAGIGYAVSRKKED